MPACDGQIDGQTSCHGIVSAMHTRRAVKIWPTTFTTLNH